MFSEKGVSRVSTLKSIKRKFRSMSSSERFCLHWNDFEVNISSAFRDLKNEKDFADVTLACVDNQVEAHKVILAASSPFFKRILKKNPHSHPLIYLKGIKSSDVEDVLKFIYQGEVSIDEGNLNTFLRVAEDLEVKGLVPEKDHDEGVSHMQSPFPKTNIESANSTFTEQSSVQTNGQLPSQTQQKFSTSGNNNTSETVHVKVEAGESLIEDIIPPLVVLEEKQQENEANCPKHHQEQCSQICPSISKFSKIINSTLSSPILSIRETWLTK